MNYPITPRPYHRMTQRSKYTEAAKRYTAWKQDLQKLGVQIPNEGGSITFIMPMPKSWSKKKKFEMEGKPHQQTPDLINLLKALEDAARYGKGDHDIWHYKSVQKVWGKSGQIVVLTPAVAQTKW